MSLVINLMQSYIPFKIIISFLLKFPLLKLLLVLLYSNRPDL